ncbi:Uncharacterised protein [Mycobacteroides abscessus subsp. abscessus]|nr:Uncharacterised protein [Mycobacteroides abscessus subsp. abscessus]
MIGPIPDPTSRRRKNDEVATGTLAISTDLTVIVWALGMSEPKPSPTRTPAMTMPVIVGHRAMKRLPAALRARTG